MPQVSMTVNGKQHTVEVENRTLLVELLREVGRGGGVGRGQAAMRTGCSTLQSERV